MVLAASEAEALEAVEPVEAGSHKFKVIRDLFMIEENYYKVIVNLTIKQCLGLEEPFLF